MTDELFELAGEFEEKFWRELRNLRDDSIEKILRAELEGGIWGSAARENFLALTVEEQGAVLRALKAQELSGGRRLKFRMALQGLFPTGEIYFFEGKFLLWLPVEEPTTPTKIALIKILFMDAGNSALEVYFGRRLGIFGTPTTLRLDEMILY